MRSDVHQLSMSNTEAPDESIEFGRVQPCVCICHTGVLQDEDAIQYRLDHVSNPLGYQAKTRSCWAMAGGSDGQSDYDQLCWKVGLWHGTMLLGGD